MDFGIMFEIFTEKQKNQEIQIRSSPRLRYLSSYLRELYRINEFWLASRDEIFLLFLVFFRISTNYLLNYYRIFKGKISYENADFTTVLMVQRNNFFLSQFLRFSMKAFYFFVIHETFTLSYKVWFLLKLFVISFEGFNCLQEQLRFFSSAKRTFRPQFFIFQKKTLHYYQQHVNRIFWFDSLEFLLQSLLIFLYFEQTLTVLVVLLLLTWLQIMRLAQQFLLGNRQIRWLIAIKLLLGHLLQLFFLLGLLHQVRKNDGIEMDVVYSIFFFSQYIYLAAFIFWSKLIERQKP